MKKIYRAVLWIFLVLSLICSIASPFIRPGFSAGGYDIAVFRVHAFLIFSICTAACAVKLFSRKRLAVGTIGKEVLYWLAAVLAAAAVTAVCSCMHTEQYRLEEKAYNDQRKETTEASEEPETKFDTEADTEALHAETETEVPETMPVQETTEPETAAVTLPAETESEAPVTEPDMPETVPSAYIDKDGWTYCFDTVEFENCNITINRLKLINKRLVRHNTAYMMIDYTIENKTDSPVYYYFHNQSGWVGTFTLDGISYNIGLSYDIKDDDFVETDTFFRGNGTTVDGHSSVNRYHVGVIGTITPLFGSQEIRTDDKMVIDLYFQFGDENLVVELYPNGAEEED